jgi:hypothetical protein
MLYTHTPYHRHYFPVSPFTWYSSLIRGGMKEDWNRNVFHIRFSPAPSVLTVKYLFICVVAMIYLKKQINFVFRFLFPFLPYTFTCHFEKHATTHTYTQKSTLGSWRNRTMWWSPYTNTRNNKFIQNSNSWWISTTNSSQIEFPW